MFLRALPLPMTPRSYHIRRRYHHCQNLPIASELSLLKSKSASRYRIDGVSTVEMSVVMMLSIVAQFLMTKIKILATFHVCCNHVHMQAYMTNNRTGALSNST